MSSFTTELEVSPQGNGGDWRLLKAFVYHVGSKFSRKYIRVPAGFITDFASIPRIFRFFLPEWAKYSKAPVLHDWLYQTNGKSSNLPCTWENKHPYECTRKEADQIFLEAMLVDWQYHKSRHFVANLEYWAVRLCGGFAWRSDGGMGDVQYGVGKKLRMEDLDNTVRYAPIAIDGGKK